MPGPALRKDGTVSAIEARAEPKLVTDTSMRRMARYIRNEQWRLMERIEEHSTLWFCVWNKRRLPELPDEKRCGLIDGLELMEWFSRHHPDWFIQGPWSDERYAFPLQLTDAGRVALTERERYDMEPVYGGLVEPGWQAIPEEGVQAHA